MRVTGRPIPLLLALWIAACGTPEPRASDQDPGREPDRDPDRSPAEAQLDPAALRAVRRMGETLAKLKAFRFEAATHWDEVLPTGLRLQHNSTLRYTVRRQDGLRVEFDDDRVLVCDGVMATLLDRQGNFYARMPVPANIDEALDALAEKADFPVPLADFLFRDPAKVLLEDLQAASYVGIVKLGGKEADHLVFSHEGMDWQLWIARGEQPLPLRISFTHRGVEGEPQFTAALSGWQTDANVAPADFAIDLPDGAEQIEFKVDRAGEEE